MITFYKNDNNKLICIEHFEPNCLIHLHNPSDSEVSVVSELIDVAAPNIVRMLDIEETSRIDFRQNHVFCVINAPVRHDRPLKIEVVPLGIVIAQNCFAVISSGNIEVLDYINLLSNFYDLDNNKINFLLGLHYEISKSFVKKTKTLIQEFEIIETKLIQDSNNSDILSILSLQKLLTFFTMALYGNELVLSRIIKIQEKSNQTNNYIFDISTIDDELVDDAYSENKQGIEMVDTHSKIVVDTMSTISYMISNNQNNFLRFLANITVLLTIPMVLAGFWGMNVKIPFEGEKTGFWIVVALSCSIILVATFYLWKKKLLK